MYLAGLPDNQSEPETLAPSIDNWIRITDYFQRRAHDNGKTDSEYDLDELAEMFSQFESALSSILGEFYSTVEGLDEILDKANK